MGYFVYMHTTPNGKKYIGITSQLPKQRFQGGLGYRGSIAFFSAIKKYGWENITHTVLYSDLTKEQAEQKEIELIAFYKTTDRRYGYNISNGGRSVGSLSEETKRKLSLSKLGKKLSKETLAKLSIAHSRENLSAETLEKMRNGRLGKKMPEETKRKIGIANKGKKNTQEAIERMVLAKKKKAKPFIQYTKDMIPVREYSSLSAYERETGRNKRQVGRCLKGECDTALGYIWRYKGENNV